MLKFSSCVAFPSVVATSTIVFILSLLAGNLSLRFVGGISLAPVYWNLTSPIFKTSKNDHIVDVNPFDEIDFVCPVFSPTSPENMLEYYLIYRVSKEEYDDCNIYSEVNSLLILNCSHPRHKRRFTILFEPFQSIPNAPEYKAGQTYYFITTSTGKKQGLQNVYQGACLHHNMKLKIRVLHGIQDDLSYVDASSDRLAQPVEEFQPASLQTTTSHTRRRHQHTRRPVMAWSSTSTSSIGSKFPNRRNDQRDKKDEGSEKNSQQNPLNAAVTNRQGQSINSGLMKTASSASLSRLSLYGCYILLVSLLPYVFNVFSCCVNY